MMRLLISSTHRVRRCLWKAPVLALITVLIGVLPVSAQPTPSEKGGAEQSMAFAIPAQPLTSALHAFERPRQVNCSRAAVPDGL